jgi:hypothetical protein
MTTEEEKAALHRQQQKNRERFRRLMNQRLSGSKAAAKAFKKAWEPLTRKQV